MYQKRTNKQNSEDAVSPVVAVMLMLVVTIVIAALVAAFATGVMGEQKAAPVVTASVDLNTKDDTATITFMSVSEPVAAKDLQLNLKSTKIVENETDDGLEYEYKLFTQTETLGNSGSVTSGTSVEKVLALAGTGSAKDIDPQVTIATAMSSDDNLKKYFALYTKKNASDTSRFDLYQVEGGKISVLRLNVTSNDATIASMTKIQGKDTAATAAAGDYKGQFATCNPRYTFKKNVNIMQEVDLEELEAGDKVDVEIIHIPSNAVVYAKTLTVGA